MSYSPPYITQVYEIKTESGTGRKATVVFDDIVEGSFSDVEWMVRVNRWLSKHYPGEMLTDVNPTDLSADNDDIIDLRYIPEYIGEIKKSLRSLDYVKSYNIVKKGMYLNIDVLHVSDNIYRFIWNNGNLVVKNDDGKWKYGMCKFISMGHILSRKV